MKSEKRSHDLDLSSAQKVIKPRSLIEFDSQSLLTEYLGRENLVSDAKAIWMGYPNLRASVESLFHWFTPEFPCYENPSETAVPHAVAEAIRSVLVGMRAEETDRRLVTANFHNGLAVLAESVVGYTAFGLRQDAMAEHWIPMSTPFGEWMQKGFDEVAFVRKHEVSELERAGAVWKIRAIAAPIRDLGVVARFGTR